MTVLKSKSIAGLMRDLRFIRESQKVTADNIARSLTPGAEPLKLEKDSFQLTPTLPESPQNSGFIPLVTANITYKPMIDEENRMASVPGESHISIENESIKMASLDDEHLLKLKLLNSWKKAVRTAIGNRE